MRHKPVLLNEIIAHLGLKAGGVFVDATLGDGGYSEAILERIGPKGLVVGIDRDPEAIARAGERLAAYGERTKLVQGNFRDIASILESVGVDRVDGVVFDFGLSSYQLDSDRGFSFSRDEALDMRMSSDEDMPNARDIINSYSESDLTRVIRDYGEERFARRIARNIVERRKAKQITTTGELAQVVSESIPRKLWPREIHPATRAFQAIRIEVNQELSAIDSGVPAAVEALKLGGRICAASYHSLEDGRVKRVFRLLSGHCECPPRIPECRCGARKILRVLTRKPVVPSEQEVHENPRCRSAKLRCAERIA